MLATIYNVPPEQRLLQLRNMLDANGVPRPHILWFRGHELPAFLKMVGKEVYFRDGPIIPTELYKYNLDFNRFYVTTPWVPNWKGPAEKELRT